jgi:hypothetical protein
MDSTQSYETGQNIFVVQGQFFSKRNSKKNWREEVLIPQPLWCRVTLPLSSVGERPLVHSYVHPYYFLHTSRKTRNVRHTDSSVDSKTLYH